MEAHLTKEEKENLVKENSWVVRDVISKYTHLMNRDDLESAGYYGLLEGIEKYDPTKGTKISTYARHWVRARVMGALYDNRTVHLPWNKINSYIKENRNYKSDENKDVPKLSLSFVPKFEISLDQDTSTSEVEIQSSLSSVDMFVMEENDNKNHVEFALSNSSLTETEKRIVSLRFGLDRKEEPMTLAQIAALTGLSVMGAQKAVNRALFKLRDEILFKEMLD